MTEEEKVIEFLSQEEEIIFSETDARKSFNSNNILINRNFARLRNRFNLMHLTLKYIYSLINVNNIIQQVLEKMSETKTTVDVPVTIQQGQTINDGIFKISRDLNNIVTIEKLNNVVPWITDNYIVQVQNSASGEIVYPSIHTGNNKITIYFIDGISSNYKIMLL